MRYSRHHEALLTWAVQVDFPRSPMLPTRPVQPSSQLVLSVLGAFVD
jgi:hypothetical protein